MNDLLVRLVWNRHTRDVVLSILDVLPVMYNRILCLCWNGNKYSCNPKAVTDEILLRKLNGEKLPEVWYAFTDPKQFNYEIPEGIQSVKLGSLKCYFLLATSRFILSNTRIGVDQWPFRKKKRQYYIQTMHGGHGLKRQELEVSDSLSEEYIQMLHRDSLRIDLMISDSAFWTKLARTIFAYPKGEILECGLPRNDIFFDEKLKEKMEDPNRDNKRYLIYCPTFRSNGETSVYGFDVDRVVGVLEKRFGGEWYIRVHCHPNMLNIFHEIYDFSHPRMIDVANEELQSLLVTSDAAITDYSSAGFEFALTNRPVFLLAKDVKEYDRGMYFSPRELPFPFAESDDELCACIENFDNDKYLADLKKFNEDVIGLKETGMAASAVVGWIVKRV